jgi:hypothetical protein
MRKRSWLCMRGGLIKRQPGGRIGQWWMTIGGALGWRKFPVSCEGVAFSRIGGYGKAAQIQEERNWSLERQRERE